ncbi:protein roadkill-like [Musca autumnalis]|uniref:protein roadkill-like n=1 Tax=Musca autumnalis TaxID=221902 RepID=UPI003CE883BF
MSSGGQGSIQKVNNAYLWHVEEEEMFAESPEIKVCTDGIQSVWLVKVCDGEIYAKLTSTNCKKGIFHVTIYYKGTSFSKEISTRECNKYIFIGATENLLYDIHFIIEFMLNKRNTNELELENVLPVSNTTNDIAKLLASQEYSDVTIIAKGGIEFKAHKLILSARSHVFAAMFKHDVFKDKTIRIQIDDIDAKVIEEMLNYIYYTGKEIHQEIVKDLFCAAQRYALKDLKMICEKMLMETMSVSTISDTLLFAHHHSNQRLKKNAVTFIIHNIKDVIETSSWKDLQETDAKLGFEVFTKAIEACI